MRRLLLCSFYFSLSLLLISPVVSAQVSLTNGSPSYTQNFDAMLATLNLPANWRVVEQNSAPTWAAGVTVVGQQASSGTPTTGATYNWGSTAAERAIGAMTSGTFNSPNSALCYFTNGGTTNITDLVLGYHAERYRTNIVAASIQFYYSLDGINWTSFPLADVPTSSFPTGASSYQFNPPNATINIFGVTITGLSIAPGSDFYFRWNINTTGDNSQGIGIDDVNVTATFFSTTNVITTGAVTGAPFTLADCLLPGVGTVGFTFTGTFNAGNIFTAQLSDDIGSFAAPVTAGTLAFSGTDPGGGLVMPIVIPPGTVSGTGYLIRVISSDPATTGTSSAPFQIIQLGACASSHTDKYRSVATGDWATLSTWESQSADNPTWIPATLIPTYLANTISIRSPHTVTLTSSQTVDQVEIESGGILENNMPASNKLTVANGTGDDIDIKPGGIYLVTSDQTNASNFLINAGATVHIENTGTIKIGTGGIVGAGNNFYGITSASFVWDGGSIFLWNSTTGPGIQVTFFPDAAAGTIPILRFSATPSLAMGGGAATIVKGRLEATAAISFTGAGTKTFRDGIINSSTIDGITGASGKFIINGSTPILGGTGGISTPTNGIDIGPSSTVSLTSDKTITGKIQLLLANSLIVLGNNNLTVTNSVSITSPDVTSYIKTNGTGKFQLNGVTPFPAGKLFVVGNSTINPLYIFSNSLANYAARVVEPLSPTIYDPTRAVLRVWNITCSVSTPFATILFGYTYPSDCGINYNNAGPVELGVYVTGAWSRHQIGLTPNAFPLVPGTFAVANSLPINYFNGTSTEFPFVIANNGAILPLDYFIVAHAQKRNNSGIIDWRIFSTDDLSNFELQRSVNNSGFRTIARINPVNNQLDYSYTDASLENGTNLYRIKVNRLSGEVKYSNTVALINGTKDLLITSMSPNPVHDQAVITLSAAKQGGANFEVYDIVGKKVKSWVSTISDGNNTINVDMSKLPAGVYHIMASTPEARAVYRFVKQ